ncbi:MAG: hypothetical protein ACR2RL_23825 [Gammaproteobacteria bacterium]
MMRTVILPAGLLAGAMAFMPADAATVDVGFEPLDAGPFRVGDSLSIDIVASYTEGDSLIGGYVSLAYDADVVRLDRVLLNELITDFAGNAGAIDHDTGSVDVIGFVTLGEDAKDTFTIATLRFDAIGAGTGTLTLSETGNSDFGWVNSNVDTVIPSFTAGSVTVVPLPATVWLLISGLVLLSLRRRG